MAPRFSKRQTAIVSLILAVLPFAMHSAFYDGGFYYDDQFHLQQCRQIAAGQSTLSSYLLLPHGEHFIPVWKGLFWLCHSTFGESSVAFHLVVTTFHAAAVLILSVLLKKYLSDFSATAVSLLWATATIGGWDGPFLWIAASHLSVGLTFLLAAMGCLTRFHDRNSQLWAMIGGALLLVGLLTMGALIVLTPALLLQYWLFEHRGATPRRNQLVWLAALTLPCLLVGLVHVAYVLPAVERLERPPTNLPAAVRMLSGGYSVSCWKLFAWTDDAVQWGRGLGLLLLAALVLRSSAAERKISVVFFVLSLSFSVLAYTARSGWDVEHVLTWGRYRYLPTLFWCVVSGCVLATGLRWLSQRRRDLVPWIVAGSGLLLLVSQYRTAATAAAVFRRIAAEEQQHMPHQQDRKTAEAQPMVRSI